MREIEKKFRLSRLPARDVLGPGVRISQGYLFTNKGELRIRKKGNEHFLTVKGDGTLSREEWEQAVPQWVFETIWPNTEGRRIEKVRYAVSKMGKTLEVDEYLGALQGLLTLECEFSDLEQASNFTLPDWAADSVDVTADKRYKNKALAVNGIPAAKP